MSITVGVFCEATDSIDRSYWRNVSFFVMSTTPKRIVIFYLKRNTNLNQSTIYCFI